MICETHRILFLHIPKTGGTTVERMIWPNHAVSTEADYSTLCGWDDRCGWLNHLTMAQISDRCPYHDLAEYLVFTLVRNPWDRLVSEFHWKSSMSGLQIPFCEYVRLLYFGETEAIQQYYRSPIAFEQHMRPQADYCLESTEGVVEILRYEHFEHEVLRTLGKCRVRIEPLPRIRASVHAHYTHYYNGRTIDMVGNIYHDDVERFGYRYR